MQYVLIYARPVNRPVDGEVLLVLKNKPAWQAGKLNLIGGKLDPGETPIQAAVRELREETGLSPVSTPAKLGTIQGTWGTVHCVRIGVYYDMPRPGPGETEIVSWMDWREVRESELLMPNLKVIVPLMMAGVGGWQITDEGPNWDSQTHEIKVEITR